jgi:hypothetical protein
VPIASQPWAGKILPKPWEIPGPGASIGYTRHASVADLRLLIDPIVDSPPERFEARADGFVAARFRSNDAPEAD